MTQDYWKKFWNSSEIVYRANPQLKVGRSINKIPISDELWKKTLYYLEEKINLNENDTVLDLCAGTGLLTIPFLDKCKSVVAVDISDHLMKSIEIEDIRLTKIIQDIRLINLEHEHFSKILFYFSIQHFTESEVVNLLKKIYLWLEKGGTFYIGDIPDIDKIWSFYNNEERQSIYFDSLANNKPIIGTWFKKDFFIKLSNYIGFRECIVLKQPEWQINAHYRFDIKYIK